MNAELTRQVDAELMARRPESHVEPTLDRIRAVTDLLGHPEQAVPVVHVGGTNGKTSTARMIDELLRQFNLRTGRFTSPHLESVTERIAVDGEPISDERFVETYREIVPYLDMVDAGHDVKLGYFEALTALAFSVFADTPVDVAVVEVGLGGTWDATNVVDGKVAVVTPISIDHAEYLGDTVELIAAEKAGIIKPGSFAVLAQSDRDGLDDVALEVLLGRAREVGATAAVEGRDFGVRRRRMAVGGQLVDLQGLTGPYDDIVVPLHGEHQAHNAATALAAVEGFLGARSGLDPEEVRTAFGRVRSPGRLEVLRRGPVIVTDAAHNPAGASALATALGEEFATTAMVAVVAVLAGKDAAGILAALEPAVAAVVVTQNSSPRCLAPQTLHRLAVDVFGADRVHLVTPLPEAVTEGLELAEQVASLGQFGVIVTGSVVTAGDVRMLLRARGELEEV